MPRERYVWVKRGNRVGEANQFVSACAREHGGTPVGEPGVLRSVGHTFVAAEGWWWRTYMAAHAEPCGWQRLSWG